MDAFYASVEQHDHPELRGKPVVVAGNGPRSVVTAASYEARPFGIHSAMPGIRARRLCPQLIFVPPNFARYKMVSRQIREIFSRHTDLVEPLSLDEAYLDVTVTKTGLPSATATAEAIRAAIREETGLTASAGVAPNKFIAKIASDFRKPDGLFVVRPHQVEAFLLPLKVGRLPGVGKVMEGRLAELGLATVADLRTLPLPEMELRFGRWGRRLYELALGIDEHPVKSERVSVQVSSEDTFETDLLLHELTTHIQRLAEKTWAGQQRETGRVARTVVLKLKTANFQSLTRSHTPTLRPASAAELAQIACDLRQRVNRSAEERYRLVGVGLSGFIDADSYAAQPDLFE